MPEKTYKIGGDIYDIPDNEVSSFLKDNPNAIEVQSFVLGKDTFDIPLPDVDNFLKDMPDAKPLKKKDISQYGSGISTSPSDIAEKIVNPPKEFVFGKKDISQLSKEIAYKPEDQSPKAVVKEVSPELTKVDVQTKPNRENVLKAYDLSKSGNYEESNKLLETEINVNPNDTYPLELQAHNYEAQAADYFSKGQFKEAQALIIKSKQNIDAAVALSKQQKKSLSTSTYVKGAKMALVSGDVAAAGNLSIDAIRLNQGTLNTDQDAIQIANAYDILSQTETDVNKQKQYQDYSKLYFQQAKAKQDEINYNGWVKYLQSPEYTTNLLSRMVVPTGELEGVVGGIKQVGEGVVKLGEGKRANYTTRQIEGLLDIISGSASTAFSAGMLMQWGTEPIVPAIFTVAGALAPETMEKVMTPIQSYMGENYTGLSDIGKKLVNVGDILASLVILGGAFKGAKIAKEYGIPLSEKGYEKISNLPKELQLTFTQSGRIARKIYNREALTDSENKILKQVVDEATTEHIKSAVDVAQSGKNESVTNTINDNVTQSDVIVKQDVVTPDDIKQLENINDELSKIKQVDNSDVDAKIADLNMRTDLSDEEYNKQMAVLVKEKLDKIADAINKDIENDNKLLPKVETKNEGAIEGATEGATAGIKSDISEIKSVTPAIEIDGKPYTGKDHAEAINNAKSDNPEYDFSRFEDEQGNIGDSKARIDEGKFEVTKNDGSTEIIDRATAKERYGFERSSEIPENLKIEELEKEMIPPEDLREEEYPDWVEKNSNDPTEISNAYQQEKSNIPYESLAEWQKEILDTKTTQESFDRFGDKNKITTGLAKRFFKKGSQTIDQIAQGLSEQGGYGEVTPQMIADFMIDVASKRISERKTTDLGNRLRAKYRKITGRNIDKHEEWKAEIRKEELTKEAIEMAENTSIDDIPDNLLNIIDRDGINISNFEEWKASDMKHGFPPLGEIDYELIKKYLEYENKNTEGEISELSETETTAAKESEGMARRTEKITEQVKSDIAKEVAEKEQQIKDIEKKKLEKLKKYNQRNTLFGDKEALKKEEELFEVESKVGKMEAGELTKDEDLQIEKLKGEIEDIKNSEQKRIEDAIKAEEQQGDLFEQPVYDVGERGASAGKYTEVEGKEAFANIENLKPAEFPELLALAKELIKYVKVRKLGENIRGKFIGSKLGQMIKLHPELFKEGNELQLARTIAHEIGHAISFLPDMVGSRGNILGHIATLEKYFRKKLAFKKGAEGELTPEDIARLKKFAKENTKDETFEREVDETITKTTPIKPEDILNIWNTISGTLNKDLYDYVAKLSTAEKKSIVIEAMKGIVPKELEKFATTITEKTGKKIKFTEIIKGDWKKKFKDLIQEETKKRKLFDEKEIKDELINLSEWWRPYDKQKSGSSYKKYRESASELYADALSVLLNSPYDLKTKAPKFFEAFFNYLDEKPEVKNAYIKLQKLLNNSDPDAIIKARVERQIDAMRESREKFREKKLKREDINKPYLNRFEKFMKQFASVSSPVFRKVSKTLNEKKLKYITKDLTPQEKAINDNELLKFISPIQLNYRDKMQNDVFNVIDKAGVDHDSFVAYLENKRILLSEQYKDKAAPGGLTAADAQKNIDHIETLIERNYGKKGLDALKTASQNFYDNNFKIMELANKSGLFTPETWDIIKKEKDYYSTFFPLDKIDDNVITAGVKKVIGGLEQVADVYITTQMKMIAMINRMAINNSKRSFIDWGGGIFEDAKPELKGFLADGKTPKMEFKPKQNMEVLTYFKDGEIQGKYVPKDVADMFEKSSQQSIDMVTNFMGTITNIFKGFVTKYKPTFAMGTNMVRDIMTSVRKGEVLISSMEGKNFWDKITEIGVTPLRYIKNIPKARMIGRYMVKGKRGYVAKIFGVSEAELKNFADKMETLGVVSKESGIMSFYEDTKANDIYNILDPYKKSGIIDTLKDTKINKWYSDIAQANELMSKALGFMTLEEAGYSEQKAAYLTRTHQGTPNYKEGGEYKKVVGSWIPFYNVLVQAMRSDYNLAVGKSTSTSYWLGTTAYIGVPALLSGLAAGGAFGDDLKKAHEKLGNYLSLNFMTIPVLELEDGSQMCITIPLNDVERMIYGNIYSATKMAVDNENTSVKDMLSLLGRASELTPSMPPIAKILLATGAISSGGNFYDTFKKANVVTQGAMMRGGNEKWVELLKYSANTMGLQGITKMFDYKSQTNTTTEYVVKNIPIINAMIRVPSNGIANTILDKYEKNTKENRNDLNKIKNDLVNDLSETYPASNGLNKMKIKEFYNLEKEKKNIIDKLKNNPIFENKTKQEKDQYIDYIIERTLNKILIRDDKTYFGKIFRTFENTANGKEDLIGIIALYKKSVGDAEYKKFKEYISGKGLYNNEFWKSVEDSEVEISKPTGELNEDEIKK